MSNRIDSAVSDKPTCHRDPEPISGNATCIQFRASLHQNTPCNRGCLSCVVAVVGVVVAIVGAIVVGVVVGVVVAMVVAIVGAIVVVVGVGTLFVCL